MKCKKIQDLREKGITLIALVVTIIILLILAGVTLSMALSGDGLFNMARKAATDTKKASEEESTSLLMYEFEMEKISGNVDENETYGEYAMEKEIKEKYGQEIKIGDQVNYNPKVEEADEEVSNYDGTWKVLGIEDGKILLISSQKVGTMTLSGAEGWKTAVEQLDEKCEKYGKGIGAKSARSLRVEDINRITGYNPEKLVNGKKFGEGGINEYGNKVTYTLEDGKIKLKGASGINVETEIDVVKDINGRRIGTDELKSLEITNNFYLYSLRYSIGITRK